MTREEARAAAQVLLAFADGQNVQTLRDGQWIDVEERNNELDFDSYLYRIKPKPREWWIVKSGDELVISADPVAPIRGHEIIKVREVIE